MAQSWARGELEGAAVWDRRCVRNLVRLCERRFDQPQVSFSKALGDAVRQAAHRICTHPTTTVDGLLRGHFQQTAARARAAWATQPDEPLLVSQDTTDFQYTSHPAKRGLGPVHADRKTHGLLAHAALVLPVVGVPVGLAHLAVWARDPETHGKRRATYERACEATALKESQKWLDGLWGSEATLPPEIPLLVIADREADFFDLFAADRRPTTDLLVRARHPRRVLVAAEGETAEPPVGDQLLPAVLAGAASWGTVTVSIPRGPQRPAREANLEVRVVEVWLQPTELKKADDALGGRTPQRIRVVEARETAPPAGQKAVHWMLLTTRAVTTLAQAERLIFYYTRRWAIEELHLVLKSGLAAERLQIEEADTLKPTLALL